MNVYDMKVNSFLVMSFLNELRTNLHTSIAFVSKQSNGFNYYNLTLVIIIPTFE